MNDIATADRSAIMESVLVKGDLSKLTPQERNDYYMATCRSLGLNYLTRPFEYIVLNGKTQLYPKRETTDQLRQLRGVSIEEVDRKIVEGIIIVTVRATDKDGRTDVDYGAVPMPTGAPEVRSNAMMKAMTKAKRRVTLSIVGLGWMDESEVETVASARPAPELTKELEDLPPDEGEPKDQIEINMEAAAQKGMKNLEAVWRDMDNADRKRLQPHLAKYKALATQADEAK